MDISPINGAYQAQMVSSFKNDKSSDKSFEALLERAVSDKDDTKIKKACQDFEGYFVQNMFKEMRKTCNVGETFLPKSDAENIFQEMLDQEYSKNIAKTSGIGISDILYKQLSGAISKTPSI